MGVVFDLDDTLYGEVSYVKSGYGAVAKKLARPGWDDRRVFEALERAFEAGARDRVFNIVLGEMGLSDDRQVVAELVSLYRCHRPRLELEVPVRGMLEHLKGRYRLGLISDGYMPGQKLKYEALGLTGVFDEVIFTEELGREFWKPAIQAFELMEKRLGCQGAQCVYVGDNVGKDFVGPNKLGWQTVQVCRADSVHADQVAAEGGRAQVVIGEVAELLGVLGLQG